MALRTDALAGDLDQREALDADAEVEADEAQAPEPEIRLPPLAHAAVYRDVDPEIRREHEQHAADIALANVAIERTIEESRQAALAAERWRAWRRAAFTVLLLVVPTLAGYALLGSLPLGILLVAFVVSGWQLLRLYDRIKPNDPNRGGPHRT